MVQRRLPRRSRPVVDRSPPPCPPAWHTDPPDFVGVGVQRAGTSWWFDELCRHQDVHRAPDVPKEIHFFDAFSDRKLTHEAVARYHRWFPRPDGGITGEWTPRYVYDPWSVPLLAKAAPEARVLLMLRDPVDRFRSALLFQLRRSDSHQAAVLDAFHRGLYSSQVTRLLQYVPRSRVLVLTYEEARSSPEPTRRRTAEFLGLDPARFDGEIEVRDPHERQRRADRDLPDELIPELTERYRDDLASLAHLLPDLDIGQWPTSQGA